MIAVVERRAVVRMPQVLKFQDLLRRRLGNRTLRQMGNLIGYSQATISTWLAPGAPPPPIETVRSIARALHDPELLWLRAAYPDLPWEGSGMESSEEIRELSRLYTGAPKPARDAALALLRLSAGDPVEDVFPEEGMEQ